MNRNGADRIIHMQLIVQQPNSKDNQQTADRADNRGAERIGNITSGRNRNQPCQ